MDLLRDPKTRPWAIAAAVPVVLVFMGLSVLRAEPVREFLDPFYSHRRKEYLGQWNERQPRSSFWSRSDQLPPPSGPELIASMSAGLCGENDILISRCPVGQPATASWALLLAGFHEANTSIRLDGDHLVSSRSEWSTIPMKPLTHRGDAAGVAISRTSLITMLVISNSRPTFEHADASGYRANYASYFGQWYINWPLGKPAVVNFVSHDSHSPLGDVYPSTFRTRVDRCIQMMAGVVVNHANPEDFNLAFPGRVAPGQYQLEFLPKGYGGTHGSRHLYNLNGGKVFDVDYLFLRPQETGQEDDRVLELPSLEVDRSSIVRIPQKELEMLAKAMDLLPWSSLSWSIHRSFRDLLLAYATPILSQFRQLLADRMRQIVVEFRQELVKMGWEASFVDTRMGDMAFSAVMAGKGNSGDLVRIVTCLAELASTGSYETLDETKFWRDQVVSDKKPALKGDALAALTKAFVLEWSNEFDYQLYHSIPVSLLLE